MAEHRLGVALPRSGRPIELLGRGLCGIAGGVAPRRGGHGGAVEGDRAVDGEILVHRHLPVPRLGQGLEIGGIGDRDVRHLEDVLVDGVDAVGTEEPPPLLDRRGVEDVELRTGIDRGAFQAGNRDRAGTPLGRWHEVGIFPVATTPGVDRVTDAPPPVTLVLERRDGLGGRVGSELAAGRHEGIPLAGDRGLVGGDDLPPLALALAEHADKEERPYRRQQDQPGGDDRPPVPAFVADPEGNGHDEEQEGEDDQGDQQHASPVARARGGGQAGGRPGHRTTDIKWDRSISPAPRSLRGLFRSPAAAFLTHSPPRVASGRPGGDARRPMATRPGGDRRGRIGAKRLFSRERSEVRDPAGHPAPRMHGIQGRACPTRAPCPRGLRCAVPPTCPPLPPVARP